MSGENGFALAILLFAMAAVFMIFVLIWRFGPIGG